MRKVSRKPCGGERQENDCSERVYGDKDVEDLVKTVSRGILKG